MKFTPNSSAAEGDGLLATDVALTQINEVLDIVDHRARTRLGAEERVELVQAVAGVGRRLEALKVVLVGEAEQHQAAQTARGASLRSVLASTAQVTPSEAASWGFAAKSMAGHDQVKSAALAGEVSIRQVRAIDTVLTELPPGLNDHQRAKAEQVLLSKAESLDAKTLATQGRAVLEEVAPELDAVADELERLDAQRRRAHAARSFSMVADGRGSILLRGQLPVLEATPLQQLVAAYVESDRRARLREADKLDALAESRSPDQRRADALIAIVNSQVAGLASAGFLPAPVAGQPAEPDARNIEESPDGNPARVAVGNQTEPTAGRMTQPTARHLPEIAAGNRAEMAARDRAEQAAESMTRPTAGHLPEMAAGNQTEQTADQLPGLTTGNLSELAAGNPHGQGAGNLSQQNTGTRPGVAAGNLLEPAAEQTPGQTIRNLPEQTSKQLPGQTIRNLPGRSAGNPQEQSAARTPIPVGQNTPEGTELARQVNTPATTRMSRVPLVAGDRPRVSVMMSYQQLRDQAEQAGLLVGGAKITAGELRRMMCDAELVPVVLGSDSEVLDVGRAQRLVTPSIRRALSLRDGGCAFPGCNTPDPACEAHHVVPWWSGGSTSLDNLVLLCPHHHGTVEPSRFFNSNGSPKWKVTIADDGYPEFQPPSRNGTRPQPMRHQRTLHRAQQHSRGARTDKPRTRNAREDTSGPQPTHTRESGVP